MVRLPAHGKAHKQELLFVYGQNGSLESWWGLLQQLQRYGNVTAADLPGFGGMDSLYKLRRRPTLDNLADYLAAFVKLRYKKRRFTILAEGWGFAVATRMLQSYPVLARKVDLVVSFGGFAHCDDLQLGRTKLFIRRIVARFYALRLNAWWFKAISWHSTLLRRRYRRLDQRASQAAIDYKVMLTRQSDFRTSMTTMVSIFELDNCRRPIDLPLWHVTAAGDKLYAQPLVEQHLRVIFNNFHHCQVKTDLSNPLRSADPKTAAGLLPAEIRNALAKLQ